MSEALLKSTNVDPNVKIPPAVTAAAARAAAAHQQQYNPQPDGTNAPEGADATITLADPAAVQPPAPEAAATTPPAAPNPQDPPATPPVSDAQTGDAKHWEHKFNSMQGRYNKASEQIAQMSETINNLQNLIATLQATPAPKPRSPETDPRSLVTPQEREEFGDEFLTVVEKQARSTILPEIDQRIASLEQLVQGTNAVVTKSAREKMFDDLTKAVPDWQEINFKEEFKDWLKLPDPYSGAIRHKLLIEAFEQNQTPRVLAFFKGFLAEEAALDPARADPRPAPAPSAPAADPKVPLETFAAPGRARTTAAPAPVGEKPIIRASEITAFYVAVAAGKYRGRDAEKVKIEQMIFDAQAEGRIQP
jgi:hypothetical protein